MPFFVAQLRRRAARAAAECRSSGRSACGCRATPWTSASLTDVGRVEADVALIEPERPVDRVHHVADADDAGERNLVEVAAAIMTGQISRRMQLSLRAVLSVTSEPLSLDPILMSHPKDRARPITRSSTSFDAAGVRARSIRRGTSRATDLLPPLRGRALGAVVGQRAAVAVRRRRSRQRSPERLRRAAGVADRRRIRRGRPRRRCWCSWPCG